MLKKTARLPPIAINDTAMRATKQNTERICALNEPSPTVGGNVAVFNQMGCMMECVEYTHFKYELATAEQFVALQMILDFGKNKSSPLINRNVHSMGLCVGTHRQCTNLINCLYVVGEQQVVAPAQATVAVAMQ